MPALQESHYTLTREPVRAFVLWMAGVPFDPVPFNWMQSSQHRQPLPSIHIFNGRFRSRHPVIPLPAVNPLADPFLHILRIGVNCDFFGAKRRLNRVKGVITQYGAPAAGAGVSPASPVGIDFDEFYIHLWQVLEVIL